MIAADGTAFVLRDMVGLSALVALPTVPDDAPEDVREGLVRRSLVMATGRCPCGGELVGPNRAQRRQLRRDREAGVGGIWSVRVEHEDGCPAIDEALRAAIARWRA